MMTRTVKNACHPSGVAVKDTGNSKNVWLSMGAIRNRDQIAERARERARENAFGKMLRDVSKAYVSECNRAARETAKTEKEASRYPNALGLTANAILGALEARAKIPDTLAKVEREGLQWLAKAKKAPNEYVRKMHEFSAVMCHKKADRLRSLIA